MTETIQTELKEAGVATLTLNRPQLHNAFDDVLVAELTAELQRLENDPTVRIVVLAANGRSFSAGADLNWMRRMAEYSRDENFSDAMALGELMRTLNDLAKPTVAKVQGAAYGGGVGLIACCDIAIASVAASFRLSEVALGLIPAVIGPYLVRAIGERQARRYFVTAERFDAEAAHRMNLIHQVVPAQALDGAVDAMLDTMTGNGPAAMVAAKDLIRAVSHGPIDRTMIEDTAGRIASIRASTEGREGVSAFLNKSKPAWTSPNQ
jgi:methylglutaconyl-CoA hydratase